MHVVGHLDWKPLPKITKDGYGWLCNGCQGDKREWRCDKGTSTLLVKIDGSHEHPAGGSLNPDECNIPLNSARHRSQWGHFKWTHNFF